MESWIAHVPTMRQGYHREMLSKVAALREKHTIYPPAGLEFSALEMTPFEAVKVVILGQDPYPGPGQAHGLAFSVPEDLPPPPSLRNIFQEITQDVYGGEAPSTFSTDLTRWAEQGVLLLNVLLTVEAGKPGSHADLGWQRLSDAILQALARQRRHLVFMLWGNKARAKRPLIDNHGEHLVLEAPHPSPLSAWRGFLGCGHFSAANAYLQAHGRAPIVW
ncbi:MAG: uracil-DNA glycosylase [Anaerolineae bacterium]